MKNKIGLIIGWIILVFPVSLVLSIVIAIGPTKAEEGKKEKEKTNGPDVILRQPNDLRQPLNIYIEKGSIYLVYMNTDNEPKIIQYWGDSYEHARAFIFEKDD